MNGIHIDHDSKKVVVKLKNINKKLESNMSKGLYFVGKKLRQDASKNILRRGRSGRVYKYKGRRHIASSPGESWANRSGKARRGIIYNVSSPYKLNFGNNVDYAKYLEFGTKKMAPRPSHKIAIDENDKNIITILNEQINKSL